MKPRYTVLWSPDAEGDLTLLWLDSSAREAIATAADAIERQLSQAPERHGVYLAEGLYSVDQPPLRVIFEIDDTDYIARVVKVKRVDPPA